LKNNDLTINIIIKRNLKSQGWFDWLSFIERCKYPEINTRRKINSRCIEFRAEIATKSKKEGKQSTRIIKSRLIIINEF
jgi:hypothetical protein